MKKLLLFVSTLFLSSYAFTATPVWKVNAQGNPEQSNSAPYHLFRDTSTNTTANLMYDDYKFTLSTGTTVQGNLVSTGNVTAVQFIGNGATINGDITSTGTLTAPLISGTTITASSVTLTNLSVTGTVTAPLIAGTTITASSSTFTNMTVTTASVSTLNLTGTGGYLTPILNFTAAESGATGFYFSNLSPDSIGLTVGGQNCISFGESQINAYKSLNTSVLIKAIAGIDVQDGEGSPYTFESGDGETEPDWLHRSINGVEFERISSSETLGTTWINFLQPVYCGFLTATGTVTNKDGYVMSHATSSFSVSITSGTGWDSQVFCIGRADESSLTITKVYAETLTANTTVQYRLEERAKGSGYSAGTNIFTVTESSAIATGCTETDFANAGITADAGIYFVTDTDVASGTPYVVNVTVYYKWDE